MSTRCQVYVEGATTIVYRHSDGYADSESGVLHSLLPLLEGFMKDRGWDPEYMTAQITACFVGVIQDSYESLKKYYKEKKQDEKYLEGMKYIGVGVEAYNGPQTFLHGDIAYAYVVKKDHVEVLEPTPLFDNACVLSNMKVIQRVRFNGKPYRVCKAPAVKETVTV